MERGSYMPYQKEMTEEFAMYEAKGDAFIPIGLTRANT